MTRMPQTEDGFTLVELLVAMALFGSMLLIISIGFINVVRIHNHAVALNATQDNARTAMSELVRAVRDSAGVAAVTPGPVGSICLNTLGGGAVMYSVSPAKALVRSSSCAGPVVATLTDSTVQVVGFEAVEESTGVLAKKEVKLTITVSSSNGTTDSAGTTCKPTAVERSFCSVTTLTSGAVPR